MNNRLTLNYGLRLEHETGLTEKNNQITVDFDQTAVSPLNSLVNLHRSGHRAAPATSSAAWSSPASTARRPSRAISRRSSRRRASAWSSASTTKTVLRGGWGLYCSPWNYPAAGTTGWGQIGYSATTRAPQPTGASRRSP